MFVLGIGWGWGWYCCDNASVANLLIQTHWLNGSGNITCLSYSHLASLFLVFLLIFTSCRVSLVIVVIIVILITLNLKHLLLLFRCDYYRLGSLLHLAKCLHHISKQITIGGGTHFTPPANAAVFHVNLLIIFTATATGTVNARANFTITIRKWIQVPFVRQGQVAAVAVAVPFDWCDWHWTNRSYCRCSDIPVMVTGKWICFLVGTSLFSRAAWRVVRWVVGWLIVTQQTTLTLRLTSYFPT